MNTIKHMIDFPFSAWIFFLVGIVSGYGFGLFIWWWKKMGKATEVYAYITFLFFGLCISSLSLFYSGTGGIRYDFLYSICWGVGSVLILFVLLAITVRMTRRVCHFKELEKMPFPVFVCPHCEKPCPEIEELRLIVKRGKPKN